MREFDSDGGEVPLLSAYPLFQRLILGSFSKKNVLHTKSQIVIMLALRSHESLNMTQLAQYLSSSNEQATRAVAPLVDEGLAERTSDTLNRTHVLVHLTDKGREYIARRVDELHTELNSRIEKNLSPDEQAELNRSAISLIRLLEKIK